MAGKKSTRFNAKGQTSSAGWSSYATHLTAMAVSNDPKLCDYVSKNKGALLKLTKEDKMTLIKKNAGSSWAKGDLSRVRTSSVKASELNKIIRMR